MALCAGTKIGPYEIIGALGAGGMGEVYHARDTKLGRDVAVKILPDAFLNDPDRVARFQREARVLASLNHPNIGGIYGLEESQVGPRDPAGSAGVIPATALVLEFVDGPTLENRIAHGRIPLDEVLPIARQIADALEAAHEHGIVHRDLKPANIKVRPDGVVKVLDFGLARAIDGTGETGEAGRAGGPGGLGGNELSQMPTITSPALMTGAGVILGTAAYMSPEQAKGRPADRRSDIWAFGCVLFEMLTGRRAFEGEDISETLAAILRSDPNWRALPAETPARVRILLRRCLERDPKKRAPHISIARLELDDSPEAPDVIEATRPSRRIANLERLMWISVAALVAVAVGIWGRRPDPMESTSIARFRIDPPPGEVFPGVAGAPRFSISPDGSTVAVASVLPGKREQLMLRRLASLDAIPVRGTETTGVPGASVQQPFWSPDGRFIAYFDESALKMRKVAVDGGSPETICELEGNNSGGSWNRDGSIVFSTLATSGIRRVSANGGKPEQVTTIDKERGERAHLWPQMLPDGRHFLYYATTNGDTSSVYAGSLDSTARMQVVESDSMATLAPPNVLLYRRGDSLMAQTIDLPTFKLTGEATRIVESLAWPPNGRIPVWATQTDTLVYATRTGLDPNGLETVWLDRRGQKIDAPGSGLRMSGSALGSAFRVSPDGRFIAFTQGPNSFSQDVWVLDLERGVPNRLTNVPANDVSPVFSADSSSLFFWSDRSGADGIYRIPVSGASPERLIFKDDRGRMASGGQEELSDSTTAAVIFTRGPTFRSNLWVLPLGGGRPSPYLESAFSKREAVFSPNGHWVAYTSDDSGRSQVVVQPFPDPSGGKWIISGAGGDRPRWRRDGRELYYIDGENRLVAVVVQTDGRFTVGSQTALFQSPDGGGAAVGTIRRPFDVTPDGNRFIFWVDRFGRNNALGQDGASLTVVTNWTAVLKKKK